MGAVRFSDGLILYYEYNGTSDIACSSLKKTRGEVERDWRSANNQATCSCGRSEPVELMSYYGGGFSWEGKACRYCMAITDGRVPEETYDGIPDWIKAT